MKYVFWTILLLAVAALALPVTNLVIGLPKDVRLGALHPGGTADASNPAAAAADPALARVVEVAHVLGSKCGNCHTTQGELPFYAALPVAAELIRGDIARGLGYYDLAAEFAPVPAKPPTEVALAKLEQVMAVDSMPPLRFRALHWDSTLTAPEREAAMEWVRGTRAAHYANPGVPEPLKRSVLQPLPKPPQIDAQRAALGRELYHDTRLSKDNSLSCASCHDLAKGGVDREPFSTGVGGAKGGINAPTVFNAALQIAQFWDGRAADLAAQADGPPNNPKEMASNWPEIVGKLDADPEFKARFAAAYPQGLSGETIRDAIATFEKTLLTPNSAFDKYLLGDRGALSESARAGHDLFMAAGCANCHVGMAMGGQSYEKMGRAADYFAARGNPTEADAGRYAVTKNEADRQKFKVPLLRNVAVTAPYFHDASAATLADAVIIMGRVQLGRNFTTTEVNQMAAFLDSLTGEFEGRKLE